MTEQKIREAFAEFANTSLAETWMSPEEYFKAGYMALLNELEPTSLMGFNFYRLPEGVKKP